MNRRLSPVGVLLACLVALAVAVVITARAAPKPRQTVQVLRAAAETPAPGSSAASRAYYAARQSPLTSPVPDRYRLVEWSFTSGSPRGWQVASGTKFVRVAKAIRLVTTPRNFGQQLRSALVSLGPGQYEIVVRGRVLNGGLALGVERGSTCLGNSFFSAAEWSHRRDLPLMTRALHLSARRRIRVVLSNWAYPDAKSSWRIERVFIRTLSPEERLANAYKVGASPLVKLTTLSTMSALLSWDARSALSDWAFTRDARSKVVHAGRVVVTGRNKYGYELVTKLTLVPGPYLFRVEGDVASGGMLLGALDARRNAWIAQRFYWYGQRRSRGAMAVPFVLRRSGEVELVLSNWAALKPAESRWILRRLELLQRY
jgi:hypothetical protein